MWQGLILCSTLTLAGFGLANLPGLASKGISPLVFALLLGLVVGNLPLTHRLPITQPGLTFATRWLLRGGIVLFGLSLTLQQVFALGFKVLLLDLVVICSVLIIGYQIGTRILGMDRETTLLTSAGSAICGAAAVLATETVIRSRPAASSIAVALRHAGNACLPSFIPACRNERRSFWRLYRRDCPRSRPGRGRG